MWYTILTSALFLWIMHFDQFGNHTCWHLIYLWYFCEEMFNRQCFPYLKKHIRRKWSQDGGVGRHGVSVSPKLGRLPAAGGGLWCTRRQEEPQSEPVGHRGTERGGELEAREDQCLWSQGDQERQTGGTLQEEWERSRGWSPGPLRLGRLLSPQAGTPVSKPHPSCMGHGGIGGRQGRSGEAGRRGPHRPEKQERRRRHLPHPLEPKKPAGLPDEVPCPLRPGVGGTPGPLLFLELKPQPPQPSKPFPALWVLSIGPAHPPNLVLA